jgi:hypothetical protein
MAERQLWRGAEFTGIVLRSDDKWPNMWRVHWPDRPPSDMVNLTRAMDAAAHWAGRAGGQTRKALVWKAPKGSENRVGASQDRANASGRAPPSLKAPDASTAPKSTDPG